MSSDPDDISRAIEALSEAYPKAFFVNGRQRRPLKHNIVRDIKTAIAKDPSNELRFYDIDDAVDWYQSHVGYKSPAARQVRHGLISTAIASGR
jgi:sRNA-binding protein